jgi:membrane fusion protein, multidrug efflux system
VKKITIFALSGGLVLGGCSSSQQNQTSGQQQAKTSSATGNDHASGAPQQVQVSQVQSAKLNTVLSLPAQIVPYQIVDVYPKVTGFIDTLRVDRGSRVREGEIIVHLTAPEIVAQRSQAAAALEGAQSRLAAAQSKLAADHGTYLHLAAAAKTPGVVAENDLQVSQQTAVSDQAEVEAATHNVSAARDALRGVTQLESYLDIRAPFTGTVTARYLHPGALVGPGSGQSGAQPIVQIEDLDRLRLVVPVPEQYVAAVQQGEKVMFTLPQYPGQSFSAPVARIAHDVDQKTRTMAVELEVRNRDGRITPGTFATVQWRIQRSYPTLFVPTTAVTTDLQRTFVVRVTGGKAEWVDVKTGVTSGNLIEVFGDLHAGDQVATRGTDEIRPGTSINGVLQ